MTDHIKKPKDVLVAKAKGRPMLTWVGKKPLARVKAYPAQAVERFDATGGKPLPLQAVDWSDWPKDLPHGGLLYHGDNKDVLAHLLANGFRGKVKLIYIDPPFDSGADYVRTVQLRGPKGAVKIDGEDYTLGEQVQYSDIWANDNYLQFMYERLLLLRELMSDDGTLYLHCDWRKHHHLRSLVEEVFGAENFISEVIWKRTSAHSNTTQGNKSFGSINDVILVVSRSDQYTFNVQYTPYGDEYLKKYSLVDEAGRKYQLFDITGPGGSEKGNPYYELMGIRKHWRFSQKNAEELIKQGRIVQPKPGGMPRYKRYLDEMPGLPLQNMWEDISPVNSQALDRSGYPTQKPDSLLERVLGVSSNPGDIVLDCFVGSGTTPVAAQRMGRRWIGCDINKGAIQTTAKRMQELMRIWASKAGLPQQSELIAKEEDLPGPAQLAFSTYRVNDYDLQIQHNEAVELACQHLGVTRTRTDPYFDGTQGGRLVKIVPFNHPLTPLDLEALRTELKTRPTEERDIMLVCLGWQHDARAWVDTYNRNRPVNKLHVVELRSDRKHGGIIRHEPLSASVTARRQGDGTEARLVVEVQDVVSPSIMQRLNMAQGVFRAQITDWRAVVDCILIDTQHDGELFNVALADVPERKQDFVDGRYELFAPPAGSLVAVKIIDMLGEELVIRLPT